MNIFDDVITEVRVRLGAACARGIREYPLTGSLSWPVVSRGNVVLSADTAVELGGPDDASLACLLWTGRSGTVRDGICSVYGPDIAETASKNLPFGKIVLIELSGLSEDNCVARNRELDLVRHDLNLQGYMIRSASQYMREWSRVSRDALSNGFSLRVLADRLYCAYKKIEYVVSVEIILITSSAEDIMGLYPAGEKASRLTGAMTKMSEEMNFDCGTCEYSAVCDDVEDLRKLRNSMRHGG